MAGSAADWRARSHCTQPSPRCSSAGRSSRTRARTGATLTPPPAPFRPPWSATFPLSAHRPLTNQDNVLATGDPSSRARAARAQSRRSSLSPTRSPSRQTHQAPEDRGQDHAAPAAASPAHPAQPNKAPSGEAAGISIPMSSIADSRRHISVGETDAAFGTRFAYYNEQIKRKLEAAVVYRHARSAGRGPSRLHHFHRSSATALLRTSASRSPVATPRLDQTALSAVRHVDTFPPLPEDYTGSYINVHYYFDPPPRH